MADLFNIVCSVCVVSRLVAGGLLLGMVEASRRAAYGLERKRQVCVQVCGLRWSETERLETVDVFDVVCGVCIGSRWVVGTPLIGSDETTRIST